MLPGDTIAAISSASGPAARMIVRLSGPLTATIAPELTGAPIPDTNRAARTHLSFAGLRVPAWVYTFGAPRSYTGEDLTEFHLPGNPLLARILLDHLVGAGVRHAEPGEFTARAYFNGRMDLTKAEGVAAAISAQSERELFAARKLLAGELASRLRPLTESLADTLALVEAGIDFADEGVIAIAPDELRRRVTDVDAALADLLASSTRFEPLTHEPTIVLAGRPNAGKSTLLNALAGQSRAVVSPLAGTTRDVLTAEIALSRGLVRLADAAGLEEVAESASTGDIADQMREHARRAADTADVLVLVVDVSDTRPPLRLNREPDLIVTTKADLCDRDSQVAPSGSILVSATTGYGLNELRVALDRLTFGDDAGTSAPILALNARHVRAIDDARDALARIGFGHADLSAEVVALDLRDALDALGAVVGRLTPDDLLGRIFASFCIGK
jgi:tRNA modification GTPase